MEFGDGESQTRFVSLSICHAYVFMVYHIVHKQTHKYDELEITKSFFFLGEI